MDRNLLLFLAWCAGGLFFEGLAGYLWFCKKPVSFSAQTPEVTDVKGYNRAVAKLYMAYGGVFVLLGLPLLAAPLPGWAACLMGAALRLVYARVILPRYQTKHGDWRD